MSGASVSVQYAAAQNAGDLNVVVVGWNDSTSAINSVTDSNGNTYQLAVGPTTQSGNATQLMYYASNIAAAAAGANTVTVTFNTTVKYPGRAHRRVQRHRRQRCAGCGGGCQRQQRPPRAAARSPPPTPVTCWSRRNLSRATSSAVGAGYTLRVDTSPDDDIVEDQIVAATGSYSASSTQTVANWWVMQQAAFRAAGSGSADTTPPSAPGALTATAASSTQINLAWSAATDNVGVTGYLIERCQGAACSNFAQIGTSTTTSYNNSGLTASSSYSYRVRAIDAAGNWSAYSSTATTGTPADTTAPSAPSEI